MLTLLLLTNLFTTCLLYLADLLSGALLSRPAKRETDSIQMAVPAPPPVRPTARALSHARRVV